MANNRDGKNSRAAKMGQLIAGTRKHFPNGSQQLTLEGASTTIDGAVNAMQAFIDHRAAVVAAQANAKTKVEAERAALPVLNAIIDAFTAYIRLTFGPKADALADFGLAPRKARSPLKAEAQAIAAAKREATREARGTKSAKAKRSVHGNITAKLVVTPNTPPAAAAPEEPVAPANGAPAQGSMPATQPKG